MIKPPTATPRQQRRDQDDAGQPERLRDDLPETQLRRGRSNDPDDDGLNGVHEIMDTRLDAGPAARSAPFRCAERQLHERAHRRPVAPFACHGFASSTQAVPAMSRCAHGTSPANCLRKTAAVIAPAGRPPVLDMSAHSLLSCSKYSS